MPQYTIDYVLRNWGEYVPFQILLQSLLFTMKIAQEMQLLLPYFAALPPDWICVSPTANCSLNTTYATSDQLRCSLPRDAWKHAVPLRHSIAAEFNLICERKWMVQMATSVTFLALPLGLVIDYLADRFGRRHVMFASQAVLLMLSLLSITSTNIESYIVFRFFVGAVVGGGIPLTLVLSAEFVTTKYRPIVSSGINIMAAIAGVLLVLTAYYIQDWRMLHIYCTVPYMLPLLFWYFVPESPRWLYSKGRVDESLTALKKIASINRKEIPNGVELSPAPVDSEENENFWSTLLDSRMLFSIIIQSFVIFAGIMSYYVLSLASSDFGAGSLYLNFALTSIIEIPGSFLAIYLCMKIGRKKATITTYVIGGLLCIFVAILSTNGAFGIIRLCLGTLGKLFASSGVDCFYTWSLELLPTAIRSFGFSFVEVLGDGGSAVAPWISKSLPTTTNKNLPFICMGVILVIASIASFLLPETLGKSMDSEEEEELLLYVEEQ